jgi:hypothetical protein
LPTALGGDFAALLDSFEATGAAVQVAGPFVAEPVGGEGMAVCLGGDQVNLYSFPTAAEAEQAASMIDPDDPSNMGTSIVEWVGNPRFWLAGRFLVLYLGDDPAVEAALTSALGAPFARGQGRAPGPDLAQS